MIWNDCLGPDILSFCWEWQDKFCNVREHTKKYRVGDQF